MLLSSTENNIGVIILLKILEVKAWIVNYLVNVLKKKEMIIMKIFVKEETINDNKE